MLEIVELQRNGCQANHKRERKGLFSIFNSPFLGCLKLKQIKEKTMHKNIDDRIDREVTKYSNFTDTDPTDFTSKEVKLISEYARCSKKDVYVWIEYWYGDGDDDYEDEETV